MRYRAVRIPKGYRLEASADDEQQPAVPKAIENLLARHALRASPGMRFTIREIDEHLKGQPISERAMVKSALAQIGKLT
jgi:hypothetical protein